MKYFVTLPSGQEHVVTIEERPGGAFAVRVGEREVDAAISGSSDKTRSGRGASTVTIDNHTLELWLEGAPPELGVIVDGQRFFASVESERMRIKAASKGSTAGEGVIKSPMPGRVVRVLVAVGDEVAEGAACVVVEAMKMENELVASRAGKVKVVHVQPGATVESGAPLVEVE
jgi:glutaconyl-CoA/methylmalonyl-CoA decarboxylase subunit gamma